MNKNRARTQRRTAERQASSNRYVCLALRATATPSDFFLVKLPRAEVKAKQRMQVHPINPRRFETAAVFEVQRTDLSGRFRKAPGYQRVHTFGLARARATGARVANRRTGLDIVQWRVRNVTTGETWTV